MAHGADRKRPVSLEAELGSAASFLERIAAVPGSSPLETAAEIADADPDIEVGELIGSGGMGVVYLARDRRLDRRVAVKLQRFSGGPGAERQLVEEARAMARLAHPNIVTIYDVRELSGHLALLMEYVQGATLAEWLAVGGRERDAILDVFCAAGEGLAAAHRADIVHRDFKPGNVIVGDDGRVRVADFGLASFGPGDSPGPVGTPAYMPPEQRSGGEVDARADQYAFCVSLREALGEAGRGRRLRAILERGIADDPGDRWPDMASLLAALRSVRAGRRRAITAGLATIACAGALVLVRSAACAGEPDCDGAADDWADAVDDDGLAAVARALFASGRPFAHAYSEQLTAAVDDYGKRWIAARSASCDAAEERRSLCLDRRLVRVRALIDRLGVADPGVADHALDLAAAATADLCDLDAALPGPNGDPDAVRELEAMRALRLTGDPAGARERGEAIAEPDDPLVAVELRANLRLAGAAVELEPRDLERLDRLTASELAVAGGADLPATVAALERTAAPRFVLEAGLVKLASTGVDPVPPLSRALESRRSRLGDDNPLLLPLLETLGAELAAAGKPERAEPHLAAALALGDRYTGDVDTRVAHRLALAAVEAELRLSQKAAGRYREVLELIADGDPRRTAATLGLGRALMNDGQLEAGGEFCARVRAVYEATGDRGVDYAQALDCVGRVAIKINDGAAALEAFETAAGVVERLGGRDELAFELRLSSASALLALGRDREAVALVERTIEHASPHQRASASRMLRRAGLTPRF